MCVCWDSGVCDTSGCDFRYGLWLLSVLLWDTDGCKFGWEFGQVSYVEGYIIGWGYKQMCYSMDGGLLWFCGIQMCALG